MFNELIMQAYHHGNCCLSMNLINLLLSCYIMVVIHFPRGDNTMKLNTLAVMQPIIFWMVLENKPL